MHGGTSTVVRAEMWEPNQQGCDAEWKLSSVPYAQLALAR